MSIQLNRSGFLSVILLTSIGLTGCQSVGKSYSNLKDSVSSMELGVPDFMKFGRNKDKQEDVKNDNIYVTSRGQKERIVSKGKRESTLSAGERERIVSSVVDPAQREQRPVRTAQNSSKRRNKDAEYAYNADMAALGLTSKHPYINKTAINKTADNTYVFRGNDTDRQQTYATEREENRKRKSFHEEQYVTNNTRSSPAEDASIIENVECPSVALVRELKSLHQFTEPADPAEGTEISSIEFTNVQNKCMIKDQMLIIDIDLAVKGTLGSRGRTVNHERPVFSYPYFIAVTTPDGNIVSKDIYAFTASYGSKKNIYYGQDNIRQIMQVPDTIAPKDHSLLIGFQLSPEELAYNRTLSNLNIPGLDFNSDNDMPRIEPAAGVPVKREPLDITANH